MFFEDSPTFRNNISAPLSGSKSKPSIKPAETADEATKLNKLVAKENSAKKGKYILVYFVSEVLWIMILESMIVCLLSPRACHFFSAGFLFFTLKMETIHSSETSGCLLTSSRDIFQRIFPSFPYRG
jgi:hypothetical protein